jgi:hypothetical protein
MVLVYEYSDYCADSDNQTLVETVFLFEATSNRYPQQTLRLLEVDNRLVFVRACDSMNKRPVYAFHLRSSSAQAQLNDGPGIIKSRLR